MLKQLYITKLFGYKTINISFNQDITLLVGKNGCGKTTILNIISSIASGNIENLFNYEFQDIRLTYIHKLEQRKVDIVKKVNDEISLSWRNESVLIKQHNQLKNLQSKNTDILTKISNEINLLFIPLSRDTKYLDNESIKDKENMFKINNNELNVENRNIKQINVIDLTLEYVNKLVKENHRKTILAYEELNKNMATIMFRSSFEYLPDYSNPLQKYGDLSKSSFSQLKLAFSEMGFLTEDFENGIDLFFEKLKEGSIAYKKWTKDRSNQVVEAGAFISNMSQVDRIIKWQKIVQETSYEKSVLQESMNNFLRIINGFLMESYKELVFDDVVGKLFFKTKNNTKIPLEKMSSGEKQIVIFFAYLIFEVSKNSNGVYIIDEPEISLHVSWQRRFAESIINVVPNLQLIFATHSPEIVGSNRNSCVVLGSDSE